MILVVLFVIVILFIIHNRLFTISQSKLNQIAKAQGVTFINQKQSFDIVPKNLRQKTVGVIFYPGALVDSRAYAPKLAGLAKAKGLKVFIVKPFLRLADLDPYAAGNVIKSNPQIKIWYVGGHSMGGSAACSFSRRNPSLVRGLFLLAAYCSNSDRKFSGPTLAIIGTNDKLEPLSKVRNRLPINTKIIAIKGANHASFGDYGSQPFDGEQTISEQSIDKALTNALNNFVK